MSELTKSHLESKIDQVVYQRIGDTDITVCVIILKSGFKSIGWSTCINADEFDLEVGKKVSYQKAFDKLYEKDAYHSKEMGHALKAFGPYCNPEDSENDG